MNATFENPVAASFKEAADVLASSAAKWTESSPRVLVRDFELCQLYVYPTNDESSVETDPAKVVLIVYAMVNTTSILDLQTNNSTIEKLREQGLTVYMMEWKPPHSKQANIGLADYLKQSIHYCVQHIRQECNLAAVNLIGVCQGGVFSLCYSAMYPELIRSTTTIVTPVNCHTPRDTLSLWARYLSFDQLLPKGVNISGVMLAQVFVALKPMTLSVQKYCDISEKLTTQQTKLSRTFMAMEQWIDQSPDQPSLVFKEFVEQIYQKNALFKGVLVLDGQTLDLRKLTLPVFNIYALKDHLVPYESSKALKGLIPKENYQALAVDTGHIGMFVSQKALKVVPKAIAEFIRQVK